MSPAKGPLAAPLGFAPLPNLFGETQKRNIFGVNHVFLNMLAASGSAPSAWAGGPSNLVLWQVQSAKGNRSAVATVERQLRAYEEAAAERLASERSISAGAELKTLPELHSELVTMQRKAYAAAEGELLAYRRIDELFKKAGASMVGPAGSRGPTSTAPPPAYPHLSELQPLIDAAGVASTTKSELRARVQLLDERVRALLQPLQQQLDWRDSGVCSSGGGGLAVRMRMAAHSRRALLWPQDALASGSAGFDPQTGQEVNSAASTNWQWLPSVGLSMTQDVAVLSRLAQQPAGDPQLLELSYSPPQAGAAPGPRGSACAYAHDVVSLQLLNVLSGVLAVARARQHRTLQGLRVLKARSTHWSKEVSADASVAVAAAAANTGPGRPLPPASVLESRDPHLHARWQSLVEAWHAAFLQQRATLVRRAHGMYAQQSAAPAPPSGASSQSQQRSMTPQIALDQSCWPR